MCTLFFFFFFKQKTAYEMRISDWSSDVCSSDLTAALQRASAPAFDVEARRGSAYDPEVTGTPHPAGVKAIAVLPFVNVGNDPEKEYFSDRSEERRVGKECVSTCRSRWSPYH